MTFWHLQMHPNDPSFNKEIEIIETKGIIGLGEWSEGERAIDRFRKQMKIGDIVLVRHGKVSLALVEVTGNAEYTQDVDESFDWFENRRRVKLLALYRDQKEIFPGIGTRTLEKALSPTTKTYQYIEQLYHRISTKSSNPLNQEFLLQDSYLNGHVDSVTAIVSTEHYLISASEDETIRLWDLQTKKEVATLQGHKARVTSLARIDENTLASGSWDKTIKVWDIAKRECMATLEGYNNRIFSLARIDGNTLAGGSEDGTIKLWDIGKKECIATPEGHNEMVFSMALIDANTLASGSGDKTIKVWDIAKKECIATLEGHNGAVASLAVIDANTLASGSWDKTIKVWDIAKRECMATLDGHNGAVASLAVIDANSLASGSWDKTIKVWDIAKRECIATIAGADGTSIISLALIDENTLASGLGGGKINLWDISTFDTCTVLEGQFSKVISVEVIDTNTFACGLSNASIKVWNLAKRECVATLHGHQGIATSLVRIDANFLASGSVDRTVRVWDLWKQTCTVLGEHSDGVTSLARIDANTLASGSWDKTIKVWDIAKRECMATLEGDNNRVYSLARIDGNTLAGGSGDGTIKVWDIAQRECMATLKGHNGAVTSLALIDANTLASGSGDGTIRVWDISDRQNIDVLGIIKRRNNMLSFDNNLLWIDEGDGVIHALDLHDKTTPQNYKTYHLGSTATALVYQHNLLVLATRAGDLYVEKIEPNRSYLSKPDVENRFYIKTLLLGDSGVGKTSLGHWCAYKTHDGTIHSTHGMRFFESELNERISITIQGREESHVFGFNLWDFGGQPEYQIAHKQNFDKTRLIFLVVNLSRTDHDDNSILFWANSIKEHYSQMNTEQLGIFVIGTHGSNEQRLEEIADEVKQLCNVDYVKHLSCDVTKETFETSDLYAEMRTYIEKRFKLKNDTLLDSDGLKVIQKIKELRRQKFFLENTEELKRFLQDNQSIDQALAVLADEGTIEKLERYIVLKPYWKNIFATAILRHAQNNTKVRASISKQTLFDYGFKVEFDKLLDSEKKSMKDDRDVIQSDADIYKQTFANRSNSELKKLLMKELVKLFLEDKICYYKNGMFVFPSRFHYKKWQLDSKKYFKIGSIDLVSTKNVEMTISTVICSLNYSGDYQIVKHLDKGVKLHDLDHNEYLIEFTRKDITEEKKNQASTAITVYAKNNFEEKNKYLLEKIKNILKHSLEALYEHETFALYQEKIYIGSVLFTTKREVDSEDVITSLGEGYSLVKTSTTNSDTDIRYIQKIQDEIEKNIHVLNEKIERFFAREKPANESDREHRILHLSDLHFDEKCRIENEIIMLQQDAARLHSFNGEKSLNTFDYIILSGDLSATGSAGEFSKVAQFVSRLIELCDIDAEKVLIVPGNHDYSREITHDAYRIRNFDVTRFREKKDYKINDRIYLERDEAKWKEKFRYFSERLYEAIYHKPFDTDPAKQIKVMEDDHLAFILMNTSAQIDHFSPLNVSFEVESFINEQSKIGAEKCKIAIGHHPLSFEHNYDFINNLHQFDYKAYIHGHVHRNNLISFQDVIASTKKVLQIGSGIFYASNPKSLIPGVPLRYNVITVRDDQIMVETREREKTTMHWRPACLYPQTDGSMSSVFRNHAN